MSISQFFLRGSVISLRWAGRGLLIGLLFMSFLLLVLRYWILPGIDAFRPEIATAISHVAGQPVQIQAVSADWDGLRPYLSMRGVNVSDAAGQSVLVFTEIEGSLSWRSLLRGELSFHKIVINRPALVTRRDIEGHIYIAGIRLDGASDEHGFLDWLLRQRQLIIRHAAIFWQDDLQKRPMFYLKSVNLRLQNSQQGKRHRFGLQAQPQDIFASRIDIRGDLIGDSVHELAAWQGRLFLQLDNADLGNWQKWIALPGDQSFKQGRGSTRAWFDIQDGFFSKWTADIRLHDTVVRLAQHLPEVEINQLTGRWTWNKAADALDTREMWSMRDFSIGLQNTPLIYLEGLSWQTWQQPTDIFPRHTLQASGFDAGLVTRLAPYLPLDDAWHTVLAQLAPRGAIPRVKLSWQKNDSELAYFQINAAFSNFSVRSFEAYPAFSGASGVINATKTGGSVFLASKKLEIIEYEQPDRQLTFDALTGRIDWEKSADQSLTLLRFDNLAFSGGGGIGNLHGTYVFGRTVSDQIDLTGNLAQMGVPYLARSLAWLPKTVVTEQIAQMVETGKVDEATFHVRGAMNSVVSNERGDFSAQLDMAVSDVAIGLPDDWPTLTELTGKMSIQDNKLHAELFNANFSGIRLQDVALHTDALVSDSTALQVKGSAVGDSGKIADLLRRVLPDQTAELVGRMKVSGQGQLHVETMLRIEQEAWSITDTQGRYQFSNNRLDLGHYVPDLSQLNGALVFSPSGITTDNLRAQILGGSAEITTSSLPDSGIRFTVQGRADFDQLQSDRLIEASEQFSALWAAFMQGGADWKATADILHGGLEVVVETSLAGVALTLPAPVSKLATETIPVRFEWQADHPGHAGKEWIRFKYGDVLAGAFLRQHDEAHHYHPIQGGIYFGGDVIPQQQLITQIEGKVSRLDWDQWRELFRRHGQIAETLTGQAGRGLDGVLTELTQFDLHIGEFEFLGSRFNDSVLAGERRGEDWNIQVDSREIVGDVNWHSAPPQKVTARLSRLMMPEVAEESELTQHTTGVLADWPAVAIQADELIVQDVLLGRLQLDAIQQRTGWEIRNLEISQSDRKLRANGIWQNHVLPLRMEYRDIRLQSENIGRFLEHHGYSGRVARGEGEVKGHLAWTGKPFSIDFPTLSGNLTITAEKGQFTELKPGIGRLLGIFDLKALPRRLMFDFYDVFGKGFGFDYVEGEMAIRNGIASATDLRISGSSAELVLSGEWDLANETQSLHMKVFPSLGLATPIAGIASMIATQKLRDPFNRILLNEYAINGSWSDPDVVKLDNQKEIPEIQLQPETVSE